MPEHRPVTPSRLLATALATTLLATALAAVVPARPAQAVTSTSLKLLTYNVAGLPQALSSATTDRATSTTAIGQRLEGYDLVHVQEDFNYHSYLYAGDTTHAYRTPTSGGAGIGSGLNTLSTLPYDTDDVERAGWGSCQVDSGDCLTPKGFTFMRLRVAEGAYVDVYNLHTNAGTSDGDETSRAANLTQLTAFIRSHSQGNAVIVAGDTNTRYTRAADTIAGFASTNGLTDAWVALERGGTAPTAGSAALLCDETAITDTCEVVDKVLYRSSRFITLNATAYHNAHADFLDATGAMLSDHDPIAVTFSVTTSANYQFTEQFGGPHGDYYDDVDAIAAGARAASVSIRTGTRVDQIATALSTGTVLAHGGTGGTAQTLTLGSTEYVSSVYLCSGIYSDHTRIFYVKITTNLGRTISGGTTTSTCVTRTAASGRQFVGFHGRSGDAVDKVGFIATTR